MQKLLDEIIPWLVLFVPKIVNGLMFATLAESFSKAKQRL